MHNNYTPAKVSVLRLIRWKIVTTDLLVPFLLFCFAVMAWVDGTWYSVYTGMAFVFYTTILIGRRNGAGRGIQAYCLIASLFFILTGLWQAFVSFTDVDTFGLSSTAMIIGGLTFGTLAGLVGHEHRLRRLEAPTQSMRSSEFPGIYRITCKPNGRFYIGQTNQAVWQRWEEHKRGLIGGRHHNKWLQADWDIYRPDQFTWEVLEVVTDPVWLLDRERHWQSVAYDATKCYNPQPRRTPNH